MLEVIGAGFGRTGTLSLKLALEQLGFGPCYHMVEVFKNPQAPRWWSEAADGRADWPKVFAGYAATVDWPGATFYAQLSRAYPDAKVILTERDPNEWFDSTQATIFPASIPPGTPPAFQEMFDKVIRRLFDDRLRDREHAIAVFNRHNADVRKTIPRDRLLVYEVAQGWAPLCRFLDVAVPTTPMPKANTREEFGRRRASPPPP